MTETTIKQLPDGKWQLLQVYDDWDSLAASVEAMDLDADWGPDVRVELTPSASVQLTGDWVTGPDGEPVPLVTPSTPTKVGQKDTEPADATEPEPWDGVFRVGDEGETRDGSPYRVTATDAKMQTAANGTWRTQPIESFQLPAGPHHYHNADGTFFGWKEQSSIDLMPPTKRGPKV